MKRIIVGILLGCFFVGSIATAAEPAFNFTSYESLSAEKTRLFQEQMALDGDQVEFAYERGEWWTEMMAVAYLETIKAIESEDFEGVRFWSKFREFKPSTRMVVPETEAAVVLDDFVNNRATAEEVVSAYEADVLAVYDLNMRNSLNKVGAAYDNQFYSILAYEAALSEGYFSILSHRYVEKFGEDDVSPLFEDLKAKILNAEYDAANSLVDSIQQKLQGFQAADLSEKQKLQRASQFTSFLALIPIEYDRGVSGTKVVVPFEVQEAVTFVEGAIFAFSELESTLLEINSELTNETRKLLEDIVNDLSNANLGKVVVDEDVIIEKVKELNSKVKMYWPAEWLEERGVDLNMVYSLFTQVEAAVENGDYEQAEMSRLTAYALYDAGLEIRLMAINQPLAIQIENKFWAGESGEPGLSVLLKEKAELNEVKMAIAGLKKMIKEAQNYLGQDQNPLTVIINSAVIVFREGLEAFLIIFALIGGISFRGGDTVGYKRPLIIGVLLGLFASILTWLLMQGIIYQFISLGEKLEAIISLIAIVVLFLITNWFFHDIYWNKWNVSLQRKKFSMLKQVREGELEKGAKYAGFLLLGLTSVYREGFETVLFLQVLVLDSGIVTVLEGLALGTFFLVIVGYITFMMQRGLPYLKMLILTGFLIVMILLIMVGKTVHTMQVVGWISLTPIEGLVLPYWSGLWLGLYSTWQGVFAQVMSVIFVGGSYLIAERLNHKKKGTKTIREKLFG